VAISGTRVVVNDPPAESDPNGRVHVYDLGSATPTVPVATLNSSGYPVAISGTRVVVVGSMRTSVYVYDLSSATPTVPVATLTNPDPGFYDYFGSSVAISGARVVVGASGDATGGPAAGARMCMISPVRHPRSPWLR
jgi:hypothetical protein